MHARRATVSLTSQCMSCRRTAEMLSTVDQLSRNVNMTFTPCARHQFTIVSTPVTKSALYTPAMQQQRPVG